MDLPPLLPIPSDGKKCNARKKNSRGYCPRPPMTNGRCKEHGGKTPRGLANHSFMTGKTSKSQYLPPALRSRYEELNVTAIENLEESIKVQVAMETRLHDQLSTGESFQAWQLVKEAIADYDYATTDEAKDGVVARMKQITTSGLTAYGVRKDIQSIHESQRKLTETLSKVRKEVQETFTLEQYNEMLNTLLNILRVELDPDTMKRVAHAIQEKQRLSLKEKNGTNNYVDREGNGDAGREGEARGGSEAVSVGATSSPALQTATRDGESPTVD